MPYDQDYWNFSTEMDQNFANPFSFAFYEELFNIIKKYVV